MTYGVKLRVWGQRACFTRPEMKVERVSYDVMTPSAARGILEAIHWKPAIRWIIDRIIVLKPIRFESIRRNELGSVISENNVDKAMKRGTTQGLFVNVEADRQQRAAMVLRDVEYVIEAHFEFTDKANDDTVGKHLDTFRRRAEKGQCFHTPCLGVREFPANFEWIDVSADGLTTHSELSGERDLGWMLYDLDYGKEIRPKFFRAMLSDGVLFVPPPGSDEVKG